MYYINKYLFYNFYFINLHFNNSYYNHQKILIMEDRKGFLTPAQEQQLDDLKEWSNKIAEAADGLIIKYGDDIGLEQLKKKLVEKWPDVLPVVYNIIDGIFELLPKKEEAEG